MAHHPAWMITRVGPGQHPRYTRADFDQEAVGGHVSRPQPRDAVTQTTRCDSMGVRHPNKIADILTKGCSYS